MSTAAKVYVCECGRELPICNTEHAPRQERFRIKGTDLCVGRLTACYVCENCGQWQRPYRGESGKRYYVCMNDCALHGLSKLREVCA